jgi:hypothetical protein
MTLWILLASAASSCSWVRQHRELVSGAVRGAAGDRRAPRARRGNARHRGVLLRGECAAVTGRRADWIGRVVVRRPGAGPIRTGDTAPPARSPARADSSPLHRRARGCDDTGFRARAAPASRLIERSAAGRRARRDHQPPE